MIIARSQAKADQCARIGNGFALPSVIGLIAPHRFFAGLVPRPTGRAAQIVFPDQSFLNRLRAFGIDLLLPPQLLVRSLAARLARRLLDPGGTARRRILLVGRSGRRRLRGCRFSG